MLRSAVSLVALAGITAIVVFGASSSDGVTVHEWGTFTTVAGANGSAIDWLPLGGPSDLPCFVEHYQNQQTVKLFPGDTVGPIDYASARAQLVARVRMETPVLYFYSPRETTVAVNVHFHRGLMTEWYPHATANQLYVGAGTLRDPRQSSELSWPSVKISPNAQPSFAVEPGESHYYSARNTDAAPVSVGPQHERFLFYRGVADFDVPLAAVHGLDGSVRIRNLSSADLPSAVLFERRGTAFGFRAIDRVGGVATNVAPKDVTIPAPTLGASFDALRGTLEHMLVDAGLYPKEASAMVETWRDSWFEEGTRVFYVVPRQVVDSILPLDIRPEPEHVSRVFVGRMEVLTPATEQGVAAAIAANDRAALERYGRFLGPISDQLIARTAEPLAKARIREIANAVFASYVRRVAACE